MPSTRAVDYRPRSSLRGGYYLVYSKIDRYIGSRRGSRIQKGGFRTFRRGGGSYRNFRSGSKLLQGPGKINKQQKIADSRRGGFRSPKTKTCIRAWEGREGGR